MQPRQRQQVQAAAVLEQGPLRLGNAGTVSQQEGRQQAPRSRAQRGQTAFQLPMQPGPPPQERR
jgi:hypothetical protein